MSKTRTLLIKTITEHLKEQPVFKEKPTIEELERILNTEGQGKVCINPDGSIGTKSPRTVGTLADAILAKFKIRRIK